MKVQSLTKKFMLLLVCSALLLTMSLLAGCAGSDGSNGANGNDGNDGTSVGTGVLTATIDSVTTAISGTGARLTVRFTVKDAGGSLISNLTETTTSDSGNRLSHLRLTAAKLTAGAATGDATHWTSYNQGDRTILNLTNNGNGTYSYAMTPVDTAVYAASAHTRIGLQVSGLTDYTAANVVYDYVPNGSAITVTRDIVTTVACDKCHDTNKVLAHGSRYETKYCVVCHNAETSRNGHTVDFKSLIHEIHTGQTTSALDSSGVAFPQDIRNCTTCHQGTDTDNWKTVPTAAACGSCHTSALIVTGGTFTGLDGVSRTHTAQPTNANCVSCHDSDGTGDTIEGYHLSNYATTHNAGPVGAANFEYLISSVTLSAVSAEYNIPIIEFQIKKNGTLVDLSTDFTGTNLTGFTGAPTIGVYYGYAQDGISSPADWNKSATISLKGLLGGTAGTITGTTTMTGILSGSTTTAMAIPKTATVVTGAMYGSFTQTGLTMNDRPGIAAIKAATGSTARRTIVDAAKCNDCHEQLGTEPYFHSGARNQGTMCGMCHTPNQTSSGWTASFRAFVHGIHGAGKRTVGYNWHAVSATENYSEIEYPGVLNNCEQCHLSGTYDFSAAQYTDSLISNMLNVTSATGILASSSTSSYQFSPYVALDNDYGAGYSVAIGADLNTLPTVTVAADTTLVTTPITAVCSSCHDSNSAIAHMKTGSGGYFYAPRSTVNANPNSEACLTCHGAGKMMAIKDVHSIK